jgi:uncharacterized protein (UPF0216 family)
VHTVFNERTVERWMALEMRGIQQGLVVRRRSLRDLLQEDKPQCTTREGDPYLFDPAVLEKLAEVTTEEERAKLRLPITLRFLSDMEGHCTVDDPIAAEVLRRLEGFGKAYPFRDGRMWLPYSLGLELILKYPTAIQRLFVP